MASHTEHGGEFEQSPLEPWEPYFDVHGDPFVVPSSHPYLTRRICDVSKSPADYGRGNAVLLAAAPEMLALLKRVGTTCHAYGHSDNYDDPRRKRIDCADDQCRNPEHTTYVQCGAIQHDIADLVERIDRATHFGSSSEQVQP